MLDDNDIRWLAHGAEDMRSCTGLMCFDDACQAKRQNVYKFLDTPQDTLSGNFGFVDDPNPSNLNLLTERLHELMPGHSVVRLQRVLWPSRREIFTKLHRELPHVGLVHAWGGLSQPPELALESKQLPLWVTPQEAITTWYQDWLPRHQTQLLYCSVVAPLRMPIVRTEEDHWAEEARAASALIVAYENEPRRIICATEALKMPEYVLTLSKSFS